LRKDDHSGPLDEILIFQGAEDGDPDALDALAELAALADNGAADARAKLHELADAGDETAAQLLTELDATEEEAPMDKVRKDDRAAQVARVARERVAEVEQARRDVRTVSKAAGSNPVDGVMVAIHVVEKADAPAAATIGAEKGRRVTLHKQHDPFASHAQAVAHVEKSAAGSCLSAIARDPRAASLDLRTLLQALVEEGNGDLVQRAAYELRGS
jgi:hypothetical protein